METQFSEIRDILGRKVVKSRALHFLKDNKNVNILNSSINNDININQNENDILIQIKDRQMLIDQRDGSIKHLKIKQDEENNRIFKRKIKIPNKIYDISSILINNGNNFSKQLQLRKSGIEKSNLSSKQRKLKPNENTVFHIKQKNEMTDKLLQNMNDIKNENQIFYESRKQPINTKQQSPFRIQEDFGINEIMSDRRYNKYNRIKDYPKKRIYRTEKREQTLDRQQIISDTNEQNIIETFDKTKKIYIERSYEYIHSKSVKNKHRDESFQNTTNNNSKKTEEFLCQRGVNKKGEESSKERMNILQKNNEFLLSRQIHYLRNEFQRENGPKRPDDSLISHRNICLINKQDNSFDNGVMKVKNYKSQGQLQGDNDTLSNPLQNNMLINSFDYEDEKQFFQAIKFNRFHIKQKQQNYYALSPSLAGLSLRKDILSNREESEDNSITIENNSLRSQHKSQQQYFNLKKDKQHSPNFNLNGSLANAKISSLSPINLHSQKHTLNSNRDINFIDQSYIIQTLETSQRSQQKIINERIEKIMVKKNYLNFQIVNTNLKIFSLNYIFLEQILVFQEFQSIKKNERYPEFIEEARRKSFLKIFTSKTFISGFLGINLISIKSQTITYFKPKQYIKFLNQQSQRAYKKEISSFHIQ